MFSQREARKKGQFPPPPASKSFSTHLRRTLCDIIDEVFGMYYVDRTGSSWETVETTRLWDEVDRVMRRGSSEYSDWGYDHRNESPRKLILGFVLNASDPGVVDLLDVIVASLVQIVPNFQRNYAGDLQRWSVQLSAADALAEIDRRLRLGGTVYRIADGSIIISTDDFVHEDVVVPALRALGMPGFENASGEFHEALDAFREGAYDAVLTKANHAFESTMKIIAGKLGWAYEKTATASVMVDLMTKNGLLPPMRETAMKSLASMMKSDVPTMRNKMPSAGHGAGEADPEIPESFAVYVLGAAAANIRLLVDSYRAKLPKKSR